MISNKMETLLKGNSVIRAMFEEGKKLAQIHGAENIYDFSIGNPSVEPPEKVKEIINKILKIFKKRVYTSNIFKEPC